MRFRPAQILAAVTILGMILSACGGGGGGTTSQSPAPSVPAKTLSWSPPTAYTDTTPLNPTTELQFFEIYVKEDGNFTPSDPVTAEVAAVDPATHASVTSFNLALLAPYLNPGVTYYVSVRAVSTGGMKSDFSSTATFSL